jgi:hypothetical protein
MITHKDYIVERERRQDEIARAMQYRMRKACAEPKNIRFANLRLRILEAVGSQMIEWGQELQCRCAELANSVAKRSYV